MNPKFEITTAKPLKDRFFVIIKETAKRIPGLKKFYSWCKKMRAAKDDRSFLREVFPKNTIGVEIGVYEGHFSDWLLKNIKPKELWLIDPWKHETTEQYKEAWYGGKATLGQKEMDDRFEYVQDRFQKEIEAGRVRIHRKYSSDAMSTFPDDYFDWVYIDGNHLYEYARQDLELSFKKTKIGGYITGDDYDDGGWWEGGVKKAVDEFVKMKKITLEVKNRQFFFKKN